MMATFLFKFSACLAIFWLVYVLLLERQTPHRFKRFYLLGSLGLSLLIPQFTITRYVEPVVNTIETPLMELPSTMTVVEVPTEATPLFTTENMLWVIYGIGVLLFSLRFLMNLYKMYRRISNHKHIIKKPFIYVLLDQCRIPHSFFKYLFFDKTSFETEAIPKEVLLHEQTHAKQLHSLDILILELLQIVFWFHPLIYLLKHHVKLNHEFLADEAVLNQGAEAKDYQNLLLQFSSPDNYRDNEYQLSSTINYSSFKKRFTVMKTQTSKTRIWLSTLLLLPIIAILFYSFAERVEVEKANSENNQIQNSLNDTNEIDDPEYLRYTVQTFQVKDDETGLYVSKSFTELPEYYKRKWIYTPATPYYKKQITKTEFNSLSDSKKYLILIDGNTIQNSELNNYNSNDFVTYSNSTISELAEMEQQYVYNLITKKGLEIFTRLAIISFNNALDDYNDLINYVENGNPKTIQKLEDDYKFMKQLYERLTPEIIVSNNLKLPKNPFQKEHQETERTKQDPVMWILINRNDQLLVDDEVGTLKSIESKLKTLANQGESGQPVSIKYDEETSKEMIYKVEELIKKNKFKVMSLNISPVMSILINRKDQLLVDDEPGTITSIENRLKTLAKQGESGRQVFIRYDKETSKDMISKVENLIKANDFKVASFDISTIPAAPPLSAQKQEKATAKQVADYNAWVKKINDAIKKAEANNDGNAYPIVKQKDFDKYERIYNTLMSEKQRENAEAWPKKFPPIPPEPPKASNQIKNHSNTDDEQTRKKNVLETYAKKHPESVNKVKINGVLTDVIEIPKDQEGTTEILGITYRYVIKDGETTYYDKYGKEVDIDRIQPPPPPSPKNPTLNKNKSKKLDTKEKINNTREETSKNESLVYFKTSQPTNQINHKTSEKSSEDLLIRQLILRLSTQQTKPLIYMLNNKKSNYSEIESYILDNPESDVNFKSGNQNVLSFSDKMNRKMSDDELQNSYSALFEYVDQTDSKNEIIISPAINKGCLEFPKSFNLKNDKTFKIKCIDQYPNNRLRIYTESGNLIYSKDNYNNDWDGTVAKSFAKDGTDKAVSGKYFYVFGSQKEDGQIAAGNLILSYE